MDATTSIEVRVFGAEFACCGTPFRVGEDVTLTVRAPDEPLGAPDGVPTFLHELHPHDDRVPLAEVTGHVERIVSRHERMVPVAGAHYRTNDPDDAIEREVDRVPAEDRPTGYAGADYRVRLRIPVDTPLPAPPARDELRPGPGREEALPVDVLPRLTDVITQVVAEFGGAVEVLRRRDDASVTLQPRREGAAAVRWNLSSAQLVVEIEYAAWRLTPDEEGVVSLRDLVAAAAAGRFSETADEDTIVSVATTADGIVHETRKTLSRSALGGVVMMVGSELARLQRARSGDPFLPWLATA